MQKKLAFLALSLSLNVASASVFGPVENFDVINDTGITAHGFEIKMYGIRQSDITSMFGDPSRFGNTMVERYLQPIVTDNLSDARGNYTLITYKAVWDSNTNSWSVGTPSGVLKNPPMDSCWPFGDVANYNTTTYPCDHFGVSTKIPASYVEYNWLVENGNNSLKPVSSNVSAPVWNVQPGPIVNNVQQPPVVNVVVAAPDKQEITTEFGEAQWAKVTATGYGYNVAPEDLVAGNDAVKFADANVQVEWQLLQKDYNSGDAMSGAIDFSGVQPDPGAKSIIYNIEFYGYSGTIDESTGEALAQPKVIGEPYPNPNDLGNWKVNQMIAVNLDGVLPDPKFVPVTPIPPTISAVLTDATIGVYYEKTISVVPDHLTDTVETAVTLLPPGLSFNSATNVISGTPTTIGAYTVHIVATDVTDNTSNVVDVPMSVVDVPIVFAPVLDAATLSESYTKSVSASGGTAPFTYEIIDPANAAGLSLSTNGTFSGKPDAVGSYSFTIRATDAVGVFADANVTLVVVDKACSGKNEKVTFIEPKIGQAFFTTNVSAYKVKYPDAANTTCSQDITPCTIAKDDLATYQGVVDYFGVYCVASHLDMSKPLSVGPNTFPNGTVGTAYNMPVTITGGWYPYTVAVSNLPADLTYSGGIVNGKYTAAISGTPTTAVNNQQIGISVLDDKGNVASITTATITIDTPKPDFGLTVSPTSVTVKRNSSVSTKITVSNLNGFNSAVSLSASGLPANTSASFGRMKNGSTTMTIKAGAKAPVGIYDVIVTGTSGALTHTIKVLLTIQ